MSCDRKVADDQRGKTTVEKVAFKLFESKNQNIPLRCEMQGILP